MTKMRNFDFENGSTASETTSNVVTLQKNPSIGGGGGGSIGPIP